MLNLFHNAHARLFLAIVIALSVATSGCTQRQDARKPATAAELSQMNKDFAKALLAKDAAAAAMLYTEDASLLPPNEPIVTGRASIQQYWQGLIDAGIVDVSVATIATGSDGDLGYEIGRYHLILRQPDGTSVTDDGKYTELLKRTADGTWKSMYGMWSADAPPAR